jgi:membrane protein
MSAWKILKDAVSGYIAHEALTRGAAIAFYAVTSLAPVLVIVVAMAGLVFGQEAVRSNLVDQVTDLVGSEGGGLIKTMLARASDKESSVWASLLGILTVVLTASGVFGEMQAALNRTWVVSASDQPWFSIIRARAASLGLVLVLGFLLIVSLAASAAISAFGNYTGSHASLAPMMLSILNTVISLLLFTVLFSAIYKVLPDIPLSWREVAVGALTTAVLFTIGKSLIGWYLGTTAAGSGYGAAGALILILLWSYYSAQIFLVGAEITRASSNISRGRTPPHPSSSDGEPCCVSTIEHTIRLIDRIWQAVDFPSFLHRRHRCVMSRTTIIQQNESCYSSSAEPHRPCSPLRSASRFPRARLFRSSKRLIRPRGF